MDNSLVFCSLIPIIADKNLIMQFTGFIQSYTQQPLILYQIKTVPVPDIDQNTQAHSYTHLQVVRPCIALNSETYITIRQQELRMCKRIGYELYCEKLFIVKHKSKYSCQSAIYFDLDPEIMNENCKCDFHYNKTDIAPTVLDVGNEIILAHWPIDKYIICSVDNDIPVRIPSHPYVLVNRRVLCNCGIEAQTTTFQSGIHTMAKTLHSSPTFSPSALRLVPGGGLGWNKAEREDLQSYDKRMKEISR